MVKAQKIKTQSAKERRTKISVLCTAELSARLAHAATLRGVSKSAVAAEILHRHLPGLRVYAAEELVPAASAPAAAPGMTAA